MNTKTQSIQFSSAPCLGFEPAAQVKNAMLFRESDFALICNALVAHIDEVSEKFEAVEA